jgi:hypothetical protein
MAPQQQRLPRAQDVLRLHHPLSLPLLRQQQHTVIALQGINNLSLPSIPFAPA